MKILFWSSTEYSGFLAGLMRELTDAGLDAKQCFQISEASYRSAKSGSARLLLRFRQYVAYPIQLVAVLARRRVTGEVRNVKDGDVCVVSTNTFYAPLLATYLHPQVVHLVYDLFPEAMIHSGKWTEGTLKVRLVRWITRQTLRRAKTNVFLGERLKDYVESIHGAVPNAAIIAVGADQSLFGQSPGERLGKLEGGELRADGGEGERRTLNFERRTLNEGEVEIAEGGDLRAEGGELRPDSRELRAEESFEGASHFDTLPPFYSEPQDQLSVLYCGNFGNMHDSATLFEYWRQVAEEASFRSQVSSLRSLNQTTWRFHCSGPKRAALELVRDALPDGLQQQIQLGGGLDQAAWIAAMEDADVALVTMLPGSETVVMPSKTYSAMMAGQAILAIAPEDSDLVDLIKAADCGWWVEPGDVDGLANAIDAICADPEGLLEKRERAYQYAHAHLGQDALAKDWERALRE